MKAAIWRTVRQAGFALPKPKGRKLTEAGVASPVRHDVGEIWVARLSEDDVDESQAVDMVAGALCPDGLVSGKVARGRADLYANHAGVLLVDRHLVDAINRIDERLAIATLPPYRKVTAGDLVSSIKMMPYGIDRAALARITAAIPFGPITS